MSVAVGVTVVSFNICVKLAMEQAVAVAVVVAVVRDGDRQASQGPEDRQKERTVHDGEQDIIKRMGMRRE